ncbi:MAG: hypothetical protein FJ253_00995 [Phycisphaerae bacterium]|nr:hypothetical protein [Phycisphaerae bacterium]
MILSALVVAIVLLIAYWWANQGLISALLHFLCVAIAGAIAFGLWEWITVSFFLRGIRFDEYAWGVSLIGAFVVVLFLLRLLTDRFAPNEVRLPGGLNYAGGAVFGLGAGVLSTGIVLTGWGYLQSSPEILGYSGFVRSQQASGQPTQTQPNLPPTLVLEATEWFYGTLSLGAFSPIDSDRALGNEIPRFANLGGSAVRDSYGDGKGKISIPPASVKIADFVELPSMGSGAFALRLDVEAPAFDRRTMFTLSASQARLIGDDESEPAVAFPTDFGQKNAANDRLYLPYTFSDVTYFASSPSAAQSAAIFLAFPRSALNGQVPKYLQVKGLRMPLPTPQREPALSTFAAYLDRYGGGGTGASAAELRALFQYVEGVNPLSAAHISTDNTINPAAGNVNSIPGTLAADDRRYLVSGAGDFRRTGPTIGNRDLRLNGILEPGGTRVVRLDASRGASPIDLYDVDRIRALRKGAGAEATPELVDRSFNTYQPFGYLWVREREGIVRVYLDLPSGGRWTLGNLPVAGDEDKLFLLYRLPVGTNIIGVIYRDPAKPVDKAKIAAQCNWTVPAK